ncbi:MAG: hypothetical protein NT012_01765 [Candidatus Nealsonbacteria bacterium]|nr:hypothetical protein [Candidatus Nealsonbacteria bacterium]
MKNIIVISIMVGVLLPNFSFGQVEETWVEEDSFFSTFAFAVRKFVKEEILPIWQKMWDWFKVNIWSRVENWIRPEIEKRKDILKEGFEGEKEEMKEELKTEVPKTGKSLWEKFKELIK